MPGKMIYYRYFLEGRPQTGRSSDGAAGLRAEEDAMKKEKQTEKTAHSIRFVLYILGKILACVAIFLLGIFAFKTAENSSQIYMLARDAFAKRTSVILQPINNDDTKLLEGIFTQEYLEKTHLDTQQTNASYIIQSYDLQTKVPIKVVFAWRNKMNIRVENLVQDISAKLDSSQLEINEVDKFIESGIYTLHMVKENGRWKVNDITLEEEITPPSVYPIPKVEKTEDVTIPEESVGVAQGD